MQMFLAEDEERTPWRFSSEIMVSVAEATNAVTDLAESVRVWASIAFEQSVSILESFTITRFHMSFSALIRESVKLSMKYTAELTETGLVTTATAGMMIRNNISMLRTIMNAVPRDHMLHQRAAYLLIQIAAPAHARNPQPDSRYNSVAINKTGASSGTTSEIALSVSKESVTIFGLLGDFDRWLFDALKKGGAPEKFDALLLLQEKMTALKKLDVEVSDPFLAEIATSSVKLETAGAVRQKNVRIIKTIMSALPQEHPLYQRAAKLLVKLVAPAQVKSSRGKNIRSNPHILN